MMIARRENIFASNFQKTRQLRQRRPFVVIGVAKTQVNRVQLIIQVRVRSSRSLDKFGDALHFFIVFRNETFEPFRMVNQTRFCFFRHELDYFGEDRLGRRKQFGVIARAALVPIAERLPFVSISPGTKNVAFGRKDEIRTDRE